MVTEAYNYTNSGGMYFKQRNLFRFSDGTLIFAYYEGGSTDDILFRYSSNDGSTWATATGTITDAYSTDPQRYAFFVDADDQIHVVYEDSSSQFSYKRGTFSTDTITWDVEQDFTSRDVERRCNLISFKVGTDDHVWYLGFEPSGGNMMLGHFKVTSGGTATEESWTADIFTTYNPYYMTGLDFAHTGDGVTPAASPHIFIGSLDAADDVLFLKYTYSSGPTWTKQTEQFGSNYLDTALPDAIFFYDATEDACVYVGTSTISTQRADIIDRDAADTTWTAYDNETPISGNGNYKGATYDPATGDIWVFTLDGGNDLVYCKWDRSANSWDASWTEVEAGAVGNDSISARLVQGAGSGSIELVWEDSGLGTVRYEEIVSLNSAPSQPTWNNTDNQVEDVAEDLTLDWNFVDVDSGDTQSKYKLQRRKHHNLIATDNQASVETDTTGFVATATCALSRITSQFSHGTASLQADPSSTVFNFILSAADDSGGTQTLANLTAYGIPVVAGEKYLWSMETKSDEATGRTIAMAARWYKGDGTYIEKSAHFATTSTDNSGWQRQKPVSGVTAPALAEWAILEVQGTSVSATQLYFFDKFEFWHDSYGSSPTWVLPAPDWYTGAGWSSTEQWVTSGTESATIAASWGADGDPTHNYNITVQDQTSVESVRSLWLRVIPSAQDNPTITAIGTITAKTKTVGWTVTTQTKHHLRIYRDVGLTDLEYDNGIVVTGTKSDTIPFNEEGTRWIWLTTWNDEGLASDVDTEEVTVDWADPPKPWAAPNSTPIVLSTSGNSSASLRGDGGTNEEQGQSFEATSTSTVTSIAVRTDLVGSPTDQVYCTIYNDSGFTTAIAVSDPRDAVDLESGSTYLYHVFNFPTPPSVTSGTTYYVSFSRTDSYDASNYVALRQNTANPYADGVRYTKNNGSWSSNSPSGTDFWMIVNQANVPVPGAVTVEITNPTPGSGEGGTATTDYNEVWRRVWDDVDTEERIAANLSEGATYVDYNVESGTQYQYKIVAWNTTNGTPNESDWTA